MKLKITDDIPDTAVVVAAPKTDPLHFPDNRVVRCRECQREVQVRPHVPDLPCICIDCYAKIAGPDDVVALTRKTVAEVATFFRKN